jgi:hypothetical protein
MKKIAIVFIIVLPLLVFVLVKTLSTGHFRNDALKWAGPSIDKTNLVTPEQLQRLLHPVLLVNLTSKTDAFGNAPDALIVKPENLLAKENLKKIRAQKGSIVLVSDDPALSARMWMLLSQLGYKKLYILTDSTYNEASKYKFRPDTSTGPEL